MVKAKIKKKEERRRKEGWKKKRKEGKRKKRKTLLNLQVIPLTVLYAAHIKMKFNNANKCGGGFFLYIR